MNNSLPRIDTHRHLGGCISTAFVWDTIKKCGLKHLAETEQDVLDQMTFRPGEPRQFHRFLDKFRILDGICWTESLINASIKAVCADLALEQIDYAWMDFSINKYMNIGWHKHQAVRFIYDCFERHRPGGVGLILSLKYESMRASQRQYAKLINNPDVADCLIGLDLVGDEQYFDVDFYEPIFRDWRAAGKITRGHLGEFGSALNVLRAMKVLLASNIAHGFKIFEYPEIIAWAKDHGVTFDMAITSNYLTGTWTNQSFHPSTEMLQAKLMITLGSDDPVQCSTTLDREFEVARSLGWTDLDLERARQVALDNSRRFLPAGRQ